MKEHAMNERELNDRLIEIIGVEASEIKSPILDSVAHWFQYNLNHQRLSSQAYISLLDQISLTRHSDLKYIVGLLAVWYRLADC